MPQEMIEIWGTSSLIVGSVGVVVNIIEDGYDIKLNSDKYPAFCLQKELEPLIRTGEQLLFDFAKE